MNFNYSNPKTINADGAVAVECMVTDENGNVVQSFQCYVEGTSIYQEAQTGASQWVADNIASIPAYTPPTLDMLKANAKAQILSILTNLVQRITSNYLPTDQARWSEKEVEAKAFTAIASENQTLDDAPTIGPEYILANPDKTDAEILALVKIEMATILLKAAGFRKVDTFTAATRINAYPLIEAATNEAKLLQIVADVDTKTNAFIADNNL